MKEYKILRNKLEGLRINRKVPIIDSNVGLNELNTVPIRSVSSKE